MPPRVSYGREGRSRPSGPGHAAVPAARSTAERVAELAALFAHFTTLSEAGSRACAAGDEVALAAALDEREVVTARVAVVLRDVDADRRAASSNAARAALDLALRPAPAAARAAAHANAELERQANAARTGLGEQLDRLRHDDAARSAYTAAVGRGELSRLDLTR